MESDVHAFGISRDWRRTARDVGKWEHSVKERGKRFMAKWKRIEEDARRVEWQGFRRIKVEVGKIERFRAALKGLTQLLLLKWRILGLVENPENPPKTQNGSEM